MRKLIVFACLFVSSVSVFAQNTQQDINNQIWKPYIAAYNSFNTEKFMALHSPELVRVSHDEKLVLSFAEYKKKINRENQFNKNYNVKATIDFRFTQRIESLQLAHESGIYKLDIIDNIGKKTTLYGKFEVTLRKENGVWKILVDSDRAGEGAASEKDFSSAEPLK